MATPLPPTPTHKKLSDPPMGLITSREKNTAPLFFKKGGPHPPLPGPSGVGCRFFVR